MRKLLFIALAVALMGCKKEDTSNLAVISGKIINKPVGDLTINSEDRSFKEILNIAADGTFIDTLSTDINAYVLYDGTNPVFLNIESGNHLNITYDANDFDNTIQITGKGSEINNYLVAKNKGKKEFRKEAVEVFKLDEEAYKERMLAFKNSQEQLLSEVASLPKDYIELEKKNLYYEYLIALKTYEGAHKYYTQNSDFQISDDFLNELKDIDYTNEEYFKTSNSFKGLVTDHYEAIANKLAESDSIKFNMAFLKTASAIESETIKNTLLYDFASFNLTYAENKDEFYNVFMNNSTNEKNNKSISDKYNELMRLNAGKPSPKFVDYENHAGGKTSLDDLKGKYVYVDVWATWCGPCVREIPFLKEVEKQYHDKNIEFVSISIDQIKDHEKWQTMVNDRALGGIQLFADNDWNSAFVKAYQIEGIPRFILIDDEGNIVTANAPRPSSEKLIELFDEQEL